MFVFCISELTLFSFPPYAHTSVCIGELAICDSGSCKVHLLSPTMQPIQRIALPFISINDLPITIPVVRKSDTMKDNKNATKHKKVVSLRSANKENGAGNLLLVYFFDFDFHISVWYTY